MDTYISSAQINVQSLDIWPKLRPFPIWSRTYCPAISDTNRATILKQAIFVVRSDVRPILIMIVSLHLKLNLSTGIQSEKSTMGGFSLRTYIRILCSSLKIRGVEVIYGTLQKHFFLREIFMNHLKKPS